MAVPLMLIGQDVLRGQVRVDLMPIYGGFVEDEYPLGIDSAYRRALEEAAMFISAQIYGWSFYYDIGERARGIDEVFELSSLGDITWGDPGLHVTNAHFQNQTHQITSHLMAETLSMWVDYRPTQAQHRRLQMWRMGNIRTAQAIGYGPYAFPGDDNDWMSIRRAALEDSARAAVRAMLQGSERNRPKEARGYISLETFPAYHMSSGRWAVQARFRVNITEVVPFAAH